MRKKGSGAQDDGFCGVGNADAVVHAVSQHGRDEAGQVVEVDDHLLDAVFFE
jgi:hypothetical protein